MEKLFMNLKEVLEQGLKQMYKKNTITWNLM